jgi:hypothetical protein
VPLGAEKRRDFAKPDIGGLKRLIKDVEARRAHAPSSG